MIVYRPWWQSCLSRYIVTLLKDTTKQLARLMAGSEPLIQEAVPHMAKHESEADMADKIVPINKKNYFFQYVSN